MTHPSVEFENSVVVSDERPVGAADTTGDALRAPESLTVPRVREDDTSSPVCAACWAY